MISSNGPHHKNKDEPNKIIPKNKKQQKSNGQTSNKTAQNVVPIPCTLSFSINMLIKSLVLSKYTLARYSLV